MKAFKVKGSFLMGDRKQIFLKEVASKDKEAAKDKVFSLIGSKHRVKRAKIRIDSIEEVPPDKVEDSIVRYEVGDLDG